MAGRRQFGGGGGGGGGGAPDQGWAWAVLGACHLAFCLWEGLCKGLGVMLPTLADQFDTGTWPVGWAIGLMVSARGVSGLFLSCFERRWNHRPIVIVSGALASMGVIAACATNSVVAFGLCVVLLAGAAIGLLLNSCFVVLGVYFKRYYAMANGVAMAGTSVGILVFAPVTQFLLDAYGWRGCLLVIGGLFLHLVAVGALMRPLSNHTDARAPDGARGHAYTQLDRDDDTGGVADGSARTGDDGQNKAAGFASRFVRATDLDLFGSLSFWTLLVCYVNFCVVIVAWVVFTVPSCTAKGLTTKQASAVAVAGGLGMLVGQLGQGPLVDREILGARPAMYLSHALVAASFAATPLLVWFWPLVAGNFAFGVGYGIGLPLSITMMRHLVGGARMSNALGWGEAVGGVARIAASFLPGWLYDRTGSYDLSFLITGSVPCLVIVLFLLEDALRLCRTRRSPR